MSKPTFEDACAIVMEHVKARKWDKTNSAKGIAISLSLEAKIRGIERTVSTHYPIGQFHVAPRTDILQPQIAHWLTESRAVRLIATLESTIEV